MFWDDPIWKKNLEKNELPLIVDGKPARRDWRLLLVLEPVLSRSFARVVLSVVTVCAGESEAAHGVVDAPVERRQGRPHVSIEGADLLGRRGGGARWQQIRIHVTIIGLDEALEGDGDLVQHLLKSLRTDAPGRRSAVATSCVTWFEISPISCAAVRVMARKDRKLVLAGAGMFDRSVWRLFKPFPERSPEIVELRLVDAVGKFAMCWSMLLLRVVKIPGSIEVLNVFQLLVERLAVVVDCRYELTA